MNKTNFIQQMEKTEVNNKQNISQRNITFEGLRVIFILFMVLHHLDSFYGVEIPSFTDNIKKLCFEGFVGVNFFFMLSGFGCVVGYKEKLEKKLITVGNFLTNRLIKLYPTYLLFMILSVFIYKNGHFGKLKELVMHLLMAQTYPITCNHAFNYNSVAWCVSATVFFYLIFTVIYRINFKECLYYIAFLLTFIGFNMIYHSSDGNVMSTLFYVNPIFRLVDFLAGMAVALYFINHKPKASTGLQIISVLVFAVFMYIGAYGNIPWLYKCGIYYMIPCILLLFAFYPETKLSKSIFGHKFWKPLASASMVIFLSHQEILNSIRMYLPHELSQYFYKYFMPWGILVSIVFIVLFSLIINAIYTKPMSTMLKNLIAYIKDKIAKIPESRLYSGGGRK